MLTEKYENLFFIYQKTFIYDPIAIQEKFVFNVSEIGISLHSKNQVIHDWNYLNCKNHISVVLRHNLIIHFTFLSNINSFLYTGKNFTLLSSTFWNILLPTLEQNLSNIQNGTQKHNHTEDVLFEIKMIFSGINGCSTKLSLLLLDKKWLFKIPGHFKMHQFTMVNDSVFREFH